MARYTSVPEYNTRWQKAGRSRKKKRRKTRSGSQVSYAELLHGLLNAEFFVSSKEKTKDPGIPNNFPYKDQILAEVAAQRREVGYPQISDIPFRC